MTLAGITTRPPLLIQAIESLAQRANHEADAQTLLDELSDITVLVAKKFTNDRTADGLLEAFYLTIGCISLAMGQANIPDSDEARLSLLLNQGAEKVFQSGFRLIKELAGMPYQAVVTDFDSDPYAQQRNIKALFSELCRAEPDATWNGNDDFNKEMLHRRENRNIVDCARWLRKHHFAGPIRDADLDANAVIAIAVIFAIANDGRIVARIGQRDIEHLIRDVREEKPDIEEGWRALLEKIPAEYRAMLAARIEEYRGTIVKKILSKTKPKTVVAEIQNFYAGIEQDVDYA